MDPLHFQLALDFGTLDEVTRLAELAAPHVDTVEAGTPLLMREGSALLRRLHPLVTAAGCSLFADSKISDEGEAIARICLEAGADVVSVVDGASFATLHAVRSVADEYGGKVWVDLLNHSNPIIRARALAPYVDGFVLHRARWGVPPLLISSLLALHLPVRLAGGLNLEEARRAAISYRRLEEDRQQSLPMEGIIVGRAITMADRPEEALRAFAAICRGEGNTESEEFQ